MSELAIRTNGWGVVDHIQPAAPAPAAVSLAEWVNQAREVASVAEMLCRTAFVPKAFVGKPAECAAAILAGQEMGMSPMAALRAIDVIEGKPGLSALALRALVQSKGHDIWVHESTATRAIVKGRRKGSDKVETSTWTLDRAKALGLLGKKNWKEQPTNMLLARATSECSRLIAADALLGMPYSTEELADGADTPELAAPVEAKPTRRTAQRAARPPQDLAQNRKAPATPEPAEPVAAAPEPEFDEPAAEPVTVTVEQGEPGITEKQITMLHTLFTNQGIKSRDDKIAAIVQVTGRVVGSSKELTRREAARVIDFLEAPTEADEPPPSDEPEFDDWPTVAPAGGQP